MNFKPGVVLPSSYVDPNQQQMVFNQPPGMMYDPNSGQTQLTYNPLNPQMTFESEGGTQQMTFQPENSEQMTSQPEDVEPEGTQKMTFASDQNTLQANFVPPNNPPMTFDPTSGPLSAPSYWTMSEESGEGQRAEETKSHDNPVTDEERKEENEEDKTKEKAGKLKYTQHVLL